MSRIAIGIYGEQRLLCEGIRALFHDKPDMHILFLCVGSCELKDMLKHTPVNVLIMYLDELNSQSINNMLQVNTDFPKVKVLVLSPQTNASLLAKIIKAGANGFLSGEAETNDLMEAVYTLRNGHDYYSKSITQLLITDYISAIKTGGESGESGESGDTTIANLSARQVEILKLWGESHSNQEIADRLFISIRTVETHKNHIMQKLNLRNTVDLVKFGIRNNLIDL